MPPPHTHTSPAAVFFFLTELSKRAGTGKASWLHIKQVQMKKLFFGGGGSWDKSAEASSKTWGIGVGWGLGYSPSATHHSASAPGRRKTKSGMKKTIAPKHTTTEPMFILCVAAAAHTYARAHRWEMVPVNTLSQITHKVPLGSFPRRPVVAPTPPPVLSLG